MKNCNVFEKGMCLGCVGLAEYKDWCGPEQCPTYQKYNRSGIEICKEILGTQERIKV